MINIHAPASPGRAACSLRCRAHPLLVSHALLEQAHAEPNVTVALHLPPEQLSLALPAQAARVVPQAVLQTGGEGSSLLRGGSGSQVLGVIARDMAHRRPAGTFYTPMLI